MSVFLNVWFPDRWQQQQPGTSYKGKLSLFPPPPDMLSKILGVGPASWLLTVPPGDSDVC